MKRYRYSECALAIVFSFMLLFGCLFAPSIGAASEPAFPSLLDQINAASSLSPQISPEEETHRYGKTNNKGVNIRSKPDAKGVVVAKAPITGTIVEILDETTSAGSVGWLKVLLNGQAGFVRADLLDEMTQEEYDQAMEVIRQQAAAKAKAARSHLSAPVSANNMAQGVTHVYPPSMQVWVTSNGIYHGILDCAISVGLDYYASTLASAQAAGFTACSYCWCLDCLFPGE
ncbi:MAG: SH3 domain-containing protein [Oscillospiraceae bacterium]|nr:SH3 domain-containing protein [Oscillospiraceae bacterium]